MWKWEAKESMSESGRDVKVLHCDLKMEKEGHKLRNAGNL